MSAVNSVAEQTHKRQKKYVIIISSLPQRTLPTKIAKNQKDTCDGP